MTDVTLDGLVSGGILTFEVDYSATGVFSSADVGDISVSVTVTLNSTGLRNYSIPTNVIGTTASIMHDSVTISGVTATNRAYDGTTTIALTGGTLSGVATADAANVGFALNTGTIADANIGDAKSVTTAITLTGSKAGNYTLTQPTGLTVDIAKAALTLSNATVTGKVYDGTTDATITGVTFGGLTSGESLTIGVDYTATGYSPARMREPVWLLR